MNPELRRFIDAVVIPALVERFLREHHAGSVPVTTPAPMIDLPKDQATV